jgi:hypothetical protein
MAALGRVPERHRGRSPDLLRDDLGGLEFGSHLARRPMILWKMARALIIHGGVDFRDHLV